VDLPLRIIGEGYYKYVDKLIRSLDVSLEPIREDFLTQQNYGNTGPLGMTYFAYTHSTFGNFVSMIPHLYDVYNFHYNVYKSAVSAELCHGDVDLSAKCMTFGNWLKLHGYDPNQYTSSTFSSSRAKPDSLVMWMLMGQASWMLSCTYEQVLAYPARILLDFFRGVSLGIFKRLSTLMKFANFNINVCVITFIA
jgi:hypothetical protein